SACRHLVSRITAFVKYIIAQPRTSAGEDSAAATSAGMIVSRELGSIVVLPKTIAPRTLGRAARSASDQSPRSEDCIFELAERNLVVVALQCAVRLVEEVAHADHEPPGIIVGAIDLGRPPISRHPGAPRRPRPAVLEGAVEHPLVGC